MRGFFATVAMMSSLLASGQYVNNGVCCDPDAWDYFGSGTCLSIAEDPGVFDGAVCDSDCSGYNDGLGCLDASCESGFCYSLTVEASPAAVIPDATTYRFYVNFDDANDQISAVFGNIDFPLEVNVPEGAFNTPINSSWNASGINPAFVAIFPELADDSYATLGLIGPASISGIEGAADPQLAEDVNQPITPFFSLDGATSLLSNSVIGASWFTINTAQNAYAGDDLTLLVMQVTTTGSISGTLNFQLFNQFDPSPDAVHQAIQVSVEFDGAGTFYSAGVVLGCTDASACNYDSAANVEDGSCEYGFCNTLTVEASPATVIPDATTYRFYVNFDDANDQISAVFGNSEMPLEVNVPEGAFNSGINSSWSASGINPAFVPIFPELADDSYATLGLVGPAATSGIGGAIDPQIVEDAAQPIKPFFGTDGATTLLSNSVIGGSWYTINTAQNAFAGDDLRVLVMQITTTGGISGTLSWQFFDQFVPGPGNETTLVSVEFDGAGTFSQGGLILGCTDETACNYNAAANLDDGSCSPDSDNDGVCDEDEVVGCTDNSACNYVELATEEDGTCEYCSCLGEEYGGYGIWVEEYAQHTSGELEGMTTYRMHVQTTSSDDAFSALWGDAEWPLLVSTTTAFYQHPLASHSAGSINPLFFDAFPEMEFDSWLTVGIESAPTPEDQAPSFLDNDNYWIPNFEAGLDLSINDTLGGVMYVTNSGNDNILGGESQSILLGQFTTDGVLSGTVNLQMFTGGLGENEVDILGLSFEGVGLHQTSGGVLCGCTDEGACNFDASANNDDGTCEYVGCPGCADPLACNYNPAATIEDDSCEYDSCVGCTFEVACNYNPEATIEDGSCVFFCPGCLDEEACNFDPSALQEDGSCEYASDLGWCDCSGATVDAIGVCGGDCLEDLDGDGVCDDVDDCIGFYDACGECNGPGEIYACGCSGLPEGACNCEGQTTFDLCGVCGGDGSTCTGCTDSGACNYEPTAIIDGGCEYETCKGCTYEFACNYDPEATIEDFASCEFGTCPGCTDFNACNYNPTVTEDDGSCTYGTFAMLFRVDMQNEEVSPFGVHVAGNFQGWDPSGTPMFDSDGDGVYEAWVSVDASTIGDQIEYKFINGNDWTDPNEIVGTSCGNDWGNRVLNLDETVSCETEIVLSADAEGSPFCFNSCEACVEPLLVTFTVDMSDVSVVSSEGVHLAGPFQGWNPAGTPLSDNGDGTWSVTLEILPGTYQFEFINGNAWGNDEDLFGTACASSDGSRIATFDIENNTYTACFNSCLQCQGGCTDPAACFFDAHATVDDGSCVYPGCTEPSACNYAPPAGCDDGSCEYVGPGACDCQGGHPGCLDPLGCNFDPSASCEDHCEYPDECGVCDGEHTGPGAIYECGCFDLTEGACDCDGNVLDECDVCGGPGAIYECGCFDIPEGACDCSGDLYDSCLPCDGEFSEDIDYCFCPEFMSGCSDPSACNYDATIPIECLLFCEYPEMGECDCDGNVLDALGVCGGDCASDVNDNGICDTDEIAGCTVAEACNYDPNATLNNGSCDFLSCLVFGCTDPSACNYDMDADFSDGSCTYASFPYDCNNECVNDVDGDGVCDELEIPGCTDASACNFNASATDEDNSCTYAEEGDCETCVEGNVVVNDADSDGVCDSDETVGCTDPLACNGGFFTDTDNSQCVYADEACEFCIAGEVVLFDEDGDGVCNGDETVGCTDPLACNGGFFTDTDNSQCIYADEACEICVAGDVVLFDADGDEVCDSDEVSGCTDVLACNFDGFATDEDDSCLYLDECGVCGGEGIPAGNCDCDGNQLDALGECGGDCESDENGNGICDSDEDGGGAAYCGWGTYWNEDSAACVLLIPPFDGEFGDYSSLNPCYFDLDLSGEVGANDLLNLLNTYGQEAGCSWSSE